MTPTDRKEPTKGDKQKKVEHLCRWIVVTCNLCHGKVNVCDTSDCPLDYNFKGHRETHRVKPHSYLTDRVDAFNKKFPFLADEPDCSAKDAKPEVLAFLTETIEQSMEVGRQEGIEVAVNKLSSKPPCTEDSPCGCHMGEVFHADSMCNCDLVNELKALFPKL